MEDVMLRVDEDAFNCRSFLLPSLLDTDSDSVKTVHTGESVQWYELPPTPSVYGFHSRYSVDCTWTRLPTNTPFRRRI